MSKKNRRKKSHPSQAREGEVVVAPAQGQDTVSLPSTAGVASTVSPTAAAPAAPTARQLRQQAAAAHRRRKNVRRALIWGTVGIAAAVMLGLVLWQVARPRPGEEVAVMFNTSHIPDTAPRPDYSTNPPTSGPHYAAPVRGGFYSEAPKDEQLVHNLEHGYAIVWYDCSTLDESACAILKDQLQGVIEGIPLDPNTRTRKAIAVPRQGMETPLALTSWGRIMRLEVFDAEKVQTFIRENQNRSPEPNAA